MSFGRATVPDTWASRLDARIKLLALVTYMLVIFSVQGWPALGACAAIAIACGIAVRMRATSLLRALVPLSSVLGFTVIMQLWYWQNTGTVLATFGPIAITAEALNTSAVMMVTLCCVMTMSIAFMECTTTAQLTRTFAWLLRPFERLGFRTDGLIFSLNVAFAFLPVLVREFRMVKLAQQSRFADFDGGTVQSRLYAYRRVFAPLLRNAMRRADHLAEAAISRAWGANG